MLWWCKPCEELLQLANIDNVVFVQVKTLYCGSLNWNEIYVSKPRSKLVSILLLLSAGGLTMIYWITHLQMFYSQQLNLQNKNKEPSSSTVNSNFPHHWLLTTRGHPTSTSLCKSHSWYLRFTIFHVLCHKFTKPLNYSDECTDLWLTALGKRKEKESK